MIRYHFDIIQLFGKILIFNIFLQFRSLFCLLLHKPKMCFRTLTALSRPLALLRGFGISPNLKVFGISRLIHTSRQPGLQTKLLKWTQSQNPLFRKQLWNPWINSLLKSGMSSSFLPGSSNSLRLFMNRIFNTTAASETKPESPTPPEETKKEPLLVQIVSPSFFRRLLDLLLPNVIFFALVVGLFLWYLSKSDDKKGSKTVESFRFLNNTIFFFNQTLRFSIYHFECSSRSGECGGEI